MTREMIMVNFPARVTTKAENHDDLIRKLLWFLKEDILVDIIENSKSPRFGSNFTATDPANLLDKLFVWESGNRRYFDFWRDLYRSLRGFCFELAADIPFIYLRDNNMQTRTICL